MVMKKAYILSQKMKLKYHNLDLISRFEKASSELAKKRFTNYYKYIGENMETSTTSNAQVADDPSSRAAQRMYTIFSFFLGLARQICIFFFGIFLGLGIVLRNPPEDKKSLERIEELEMQNSKLSAKLKNIPKEDTDKPVFGEVKDIVIIKN